MLLSQMEASNYSYFDSIEPRAKRSECVNAIKYIKKLAALTNTDVSTWNIDELFKHPEKQGFVVTDKTAINQIFFKYKEIAPATQGVVPDEYAAKLIALQKKRRATSANHLKDRAKSKEREALTQYQRFQTLLSEAANFRKQYETMIGYEASYAVELKDVLSEGFWELHEITDTLICVRTKHDVHLNFVNKRHGAYMNVNLGQILIKWDVCRASIHGHKYKNNIEINGYIHPHIGSGGAICFGDVSTEIGEWLASGNLPKTLELLQKVLTSYNDNSAYVSISNFYRHRIAKDNRISPDDVKPDFTFDPELIGSEPSEEDGVWVEIDASASRVDPATVHVPVIEEETEEEYEEDFDPADMTDEPEEINF